jgi:hypothetical protein
MSLKAFAAFACAICDDWTSDDFTDAFLILEAVEHGERDVKSILGEVGESVH